MELDFSDVNIPEDVRKKVRASFISRLAIGHLYPCAIIFAQASEMTQPSAAYTKAMDDVANAKKQFTAVENDYNVLTAALTSLDNAKRYHSPPSTLIAWGAWAVVSFLPFSLVANAKNTTEKIVFGQLQEFIESKLAGAVRFVVPSRLIEIFNFKINSSVCHVSQQS